MEGEDTFPNSQYNIDNFRTPEFSIHDDLINIYSK